MIMSQNRTTKAATASAETARAETVRPTGYKPAWWLPNRHLQTIWPSIFWRNPFVDCQQEWLTLPDGDEVELALLSSGDRQAPTVLLLHGMEGSAGSPGIQRMLAAVKAQGWNAAVMHFRNCGERPNKSAGFYHAGSTADLDCCVRHLVKRHNSPLVGIFSLSLGANVMIRWLAETKDAQQLCRSGIGVSLPLDLHSTAAAANSGFNRLYQFRVLQSYKQNLLRKPEFFQDLEQRKQLLATPTMFDFDRDYTAPRHGFDSVEEYYDSCSSYQYIPAVKIPTLIINAKNDPIVPAIDELTGQGEKQLNNAVIEYHSSGGHLGFIEGASPFKASYYPARRAISFINEYMNKECYSNEPISTHDPALSQGEC